MKGSKPTIWLV